MPRKTDKQHQIDKPDNKGGPHEIISDFPPGIILSRSLSFNRSVGRVS